MKILGHSGLKPRTEKVRIGESADDGTELELELKAPKLRCIDEVRESLRQPDPPEEPTAPSTGEVARSPRGEVLKDEFARPIVGRNYQDPTYLEKLKAHKKAVEDYAEVANRHYRALTMGVLLECLDGQVELDAKREDYEEWEGTGQRPAPKKGELVDYYDRAWEEFEAAQFDLPCFRRLTDAALRLSGVRSEEVDDAKEALGSSSGN